MADPKFRLSFTESQIEFLYSLVPTHETGIRLIFEAFFLKRQLGMREPDYIPTPRPSSENLTLAKLGVNNPAKLSPDAAREAAYQKWKQSPQSCSAEELIQASDYRYTFNLMNPQERAEYEHSLMGGMFDTHPSNPEITGE